MKVPLPVVVCGVAGSGKTTLARAFAAASGWAFIEGDDLHPPANIARMARGEPLDDVHRAPWLDAVAARLALWRAAATPGIVTCSALRYRYRDRLRAAGPVRFVFLDAGAALVATRLARRAGHFMPPALAASQFAALEPPGADEALRIDAALPLTAQLAALGAALAVQLRAVTGSSSVSCAAAASRG